MNLTYTIESKKSTTVEPIQTHLQQVTSVVTKHVNNSIKISSQGYKKTISLAVMKRDLSHVDYIWGSPFYKKYGVAGCSM